MRDQDPRQENWGGSPESSYPDGEGSTTRYEGYGQVRPPDSYGDQGGKKRSGLKLVLVLFLVFMLVVAIFFVPLFVGYRFPWESGRVYPEKAEFVLRRDITLTSRDRISYEIDLPIPESIDNIQEIHEVKGDPDPEYIEKYGYDWMVWERTFGSMVSRDKRSETVSITYSLSTETVEWAYSSQDSGDLDDIDEELKERYNKNQWQLGIDRNGDGENDWMIQPDHPVLKEKAEEIVEGESNIYDMSRALYDWLDENIVYRRDDIEGDNRPKHAIWTYDERAGDCDEQSFLYISMARAVGIPTCIELGVLYDRVRDDWGGHGWVRLKFVTAEGEVGWVNIDPVNDQFFARDALRFTIWADDGKETDGESHLEDFYTFLHFSGGRLDDWEESFETLDMDKSGRVVIGEESFLSGFQGALFVKVGTMTTLIYWYKKKLKGS